MSHQKHYNYIQCTISFLKRYIAAAEWMMFVHFTMVKVPRHLSVRLNDSKQGNINYAVTASHCLNTQFISEEANV